MQQPGIEAVATVSCAHRLSSWGKERTNDTTRARLLQTAEDIQFPHAFK